ncbi:MAG: metal ABC transporter permease [Planctomycetia bacterium]|nr:metal ABC transporter permease [Planctomycetia bacterium]
MTPLASLMQLLPYNTLVVAGGVAAVGCAAGALVGVALTLLVTGQRSLGMLLAGGLVSAIVALGLLVLIRRFTRTRDDAATAIVLSVSFGLGIVLISGMVARGVPGSGGLERFLLGHTAALTAGDAILLGVVSLVAVLVVVVGLKEATLVAFDPAFAAAAGWPATAIDLGLVALVAVMVVVGLPAAGAVLVTALVVIPPVAARQWTERIVPMLVLAGGIGLASGLAGVAISSVAPRLPTGPVVVLVAAGCFAFSLLLAPRRGLLARWRRRRHLVVEAADQQQEAD